MNHLIKDLDSIVLGYVPVFQLHDMKKLYPKEMKYFLGKKTIGDKIRVKQRLSCGKTQSMYITEKGDLYSTRHGDNGQLGFTDKKVFEKVAENVVFASCGDFSMYIPNEGYLYDSRTYYNTCKILCNTGPDKSVRNLKDDGWKFDKTAMNVRSVSCGHEHSMFITNEDHLSGDTRTCLYAAGSNNSGQLGLGDSKDRDVKVAENIASVSCGEYHSMYITTEGHLYATGYYYYGQLGLTGARDRKIFTKVAENVVSVSCGMYHSMYIDKEGQLYATGWNHSGQLGLGDNTDRDTFTRVAENVVFVSCGNSHSMYITDKNDLYGAGYNRSGELGLGDKDDRFKFEKITENVASVSCGTYYSMYINEQGGVYATGKNNKGQLGLGDHHNRDQFEKIKIE